MCVVPTETQVETKPEAQPGQSVPPAPVPQLLVELPSWPRVFFANLRDLILPRRFPVLELRSAPAPFWSDVFVERTLPWDSFLKSVACHVLACALLVEFGRLLAIQPVAVPRPAFDHAQVVYYSPSEYLPPLDTREAHADVPRKPDPELSRQPIISVPREPDNRSQTIVTPPKVRLKNDLALPNIVDWSDTPQKPQLAIPPAPLTLASDITRVAPQLSSVVTPPPDASHLTQQRDQPNLQAQVVAPPPSVEVTSNRPVGDLNIGESPVIAPAPSLPVAEQRTIAGSPSIASQVVPPPPSTPASGSFGSAGRIIALNLHPAVGAPANPPAGNRRGSFAATPEGHSGATGDPGSSGTPGSKEAVNGSNGIGSNTKGAGNLPAGLYVGSASTRPAPVAGDPANAARNSVNPNLLASARPLRVTSATQPDAAKLSAPERAVFGDRKFYSVTLNMPNLNSAGGSWIIRFAELNHDSSDSDSKFRDANNADPNHSAVDLSQPQATRKVDPAYPMQLMRENVAGTVILYAVIHADGTVGNVRVLRGVDERLDRFASEAVAQWKFNPATKNGSPVDVEATFQIPFKPSRIGTSF
jgi:TonB family protein